MYLIISLLLFFMIWVYIHIGNKLHEFLKQQKNIVFWKRNLIQMFWPFIAGYICIYTLCMLINDDTFRVKVG